MRHAPHVGAVLALAALATLTSQAIACPAQTLTTLVNFNYASGADPDALAIAPGGVLYGRTTYGGPQATPTTNGEGTLFRYTTATGDLSTLTSFPGNSGSPVLSLIAGDQGTLYGTLSDSLFRADPGGLTTLASFPGPRTSPGPGLVADGQSGD